MDIDFYVNNSPNEYVNKQLSPIKTVSGVFKENAPVEQFDAIVAYDSELLKATYCYCGKFRRYYNIKVETMPGGRLHVFGDVDPLMSFKDSLLSLPVIINKQENIRLSNKYLNDGSFVSQVNEFNTSYNFPGGFSDNPVYILICAGG